MMMKHAMRLAVCAVLLAGAAACSNGKLVSNPLIDSALGRVGLNIGGAAPATAPAEIVSIGPPLIVGYEAVRVALPLTSESGKSKLYLSPDGVEIATYNGFATRVTGIGVDLQGAFLDGEGIYAGDFVAAARAGGEGERIAEYWEKGRIRRDIYRCTMKLGTIESGREVIDETCKRVFGDYSFGNRYWLEGDQIICSRQWFHPQADFLQFFTSAEQATTIDLRSGNC